VAHLHGVQERRGTRQRQPKPAWCANGVGSGKAAAS
jgi:hypothetical protein